MPYFGDLWGSLGEHVAGSESAVRLLFEHGLDPQWARLLKAETIEIWAGTGQLAAKIDNIAAVSATATDAWRAAPSGEGDQ
jgi:hypothetical protein